MAQVLLVEPDRYLANVYLEALENAGHKVNVANTAQAAIRLADIAHPDVIILELQLVEHSGVEFLYEFRSYVDWQDIPVIAHTIVPPAEFNRSKKLLADELGVRLYLYKPHTTLVRLLSGINQVSLVKR